MRQLRPFWNFWLLILGLCFYSTASAAVVPTIERQIAILRALDKVTARVEELEVPIGSPYKFGTLSITVRACRVTPPEETPESAAFLEIGEFKASASATPIFRGWMFASSPALSAMEHPVYDIWVTGCKDNAPTAATLPPPAQPVLTAPILPMPLAVPAVVPPVQPAPSNVPALLNAPAATNAPVPSK